MKNEEFIQGLRIRLLLPPNIPPALRNGPNTFRCDNCKLDFPDRMVDATSGVEVMSCTPTVHCMHCLGCQYNWKSRHDNVVMCLRDMLGKVYGESSVVCEVPVHDSIGTKVVADLQLSVPGGVTKWFDVSIVSPACDTYLRMGSHMEPLTAARSQEAEKRRHYAPALVAMGSMEEQFVPFVLEASGRLGEAARAYLLRLVEDASEERKRLVQDIVSFQLKRIQTVIARQNAWMAIRCQMKPLQHAVMARMIPETGTPVGSSMANLSPIGSPSESGEFSDGSSVVAEG